MEPYIWVHEDEFMGEADCGCKMVEGWNGGGSAYFQCEFHAAAEDMLDALELTKVTIQRLDKHGSAQGTLDLINAITDKARGKLAS